jgi:hypothetical protein
MIAWPMALDGAAMDLARQQQRIDRHAEIVDHDIISDLLKGQMSFRRNSTCNLANANRAADLHGIGFSLVVDR